MADNKPVLAGDNVSFTGAFDELSDGAFSPKISLLDGTTSPTPISPATSGLQTSANTKLDTLHTDLVAVEGYVDGIEALLTATNAKDFATQTTLAAVLAGFKAEDSVHGSGDLGIQALTVRKDTAAATAGTDGDYQPLTTGADGRLHVRGYADVVTVAITGSTTPAYTAGDVVGGLMSAALAPANDVPFYVTGIQLVCKAALTPNVRVVFFSAAPTTIADNVAYTLNSTDILLAKKTVSSSVLGAAWAAHGATSKSLYLADKPFLLKPLAGTQNINFFLIDDTGGTLTSTTDYQITFSVQGA